MLKIPMLSFNQILKRHAEITKRAAGDAAEVLAETFLHQQGLSTVARNYHCRFGEIDLIMQAPDSLVFVEVRMRKSSDFGGARESISPHKQKRIIRAAEHYLSQLPQMPPCRFDAVLLVGLDSKNIEWVRGAFDAN